MTHAPCLKELAARKGLVDRQAPYWNILEYCRHIGIEKRRGRPVFWLARVRKKDGRYKQYRLAEDVLSSRNGLDYDEAAILANQWFNLPETKAIAAASYPVGTTTVLFYSRNRNCFTVGDALLDYVEWKRIAATRTTLETLVSLINYHLIPRCGDLKPEDLSGSFLTEFCRDVLETPPKRGNQPVGVKVKLEHIDLDALRRRKGTLNTLLSILKYALQMAWENGDIESERVWRRIRRVPNSVLPRQLFLSRKQCRKLISECRADLADLVRAALYTGCRVSELSEIRVRDVGRNCFGVFVGPGKSRKPRHVYLPIEGMRFFIERCQGLEDDQRVFTTLSGHQWARRYRHLFRSAVCRAGLPDSFVFHGLRHTYASQLVQAGAPLMIVARQLGHANTDTVSRTYGHLSCSSIESEIQQRFAVLEGQSTRYDNQIKRIKTSLQAEHVDLPLSSWPRSNYSKFSGELLQQLKWR